MQSQKANSHHLGDKCAQSLQRYHPFLVTVICVPYTLSPRKLVPFRFKWKARRGDSHRAISSGLLQCLVKTFSPVGPSCRGTEPFQIQEKKNKRKKRYCEATRRMTGSVGMACWFFPFRTLRLEAGVCIGLWLCQCFSLYMCFILYMCFVLFFVAAAVATKFPPRGTIKGLFYSIKWTMTRACALFMEVGR